MFKKRYTFWLDDIKILNKYTEILPTNRMTFVEQLNALTRLCLLIIILLCVFGKSDLISLPIMFIIFIIMIYYIFESDNKGKKKELDRIYPELELPQIKEYENASKMVPTIDNPFMNPTIENFNTENQPVVSPISYDDIDEINNEDEKIKQVFNANLYKNIEDVYDKKNSDRQFFSVAKNIPNDQEAFAKWCYNFPDTCKENQSRCLRYQDLRWPGN